MYREYYAGEAFVQILGDKLPELKICGGDQQLSDRVKI